MQVTHCDVCGGSRLRPLWLQWSRCELCGSDSAPWSYDPGHYDQSFADRLADHREHGPLDADGLRHDMTTNTTWFDRLPVPERSILDAGCAFGVSRQVFEGKGWRWHGWDVARYAEQDAAVVVAPEVPDLAPVGAIMAREVIEHVPDPVGLLERFHAITLPGGWLQVQTPRPTDQLDAILYDPQHLRLYSPEGLAGLLWSTGWCVRETLVWPIGQCVVARRLDSKAKVRN